MSWLQNQQLTIVCVGFDLCAKEELSQQEGIRTPLGPEHRNQGGQAGGRTGQGENPDWTFCVHQKDQQRGHEAWDLRPPGEAPAT